VSCWRSESGVAAIRRKPLRHDSAWSFFGPYIVDHAGIAIGHFRARPIPILEAVFDGFIAFVGIHVGMTAPAEMWIVHFNFNARARCDRSPTVQARVVEWRDKIAKPFRPDGDTTVNFHGDRDIDFINVNGERLTVPVQTAGANLVMLGVARNVRSTALCHGPTLAAFAIQRHIQSAMVFSLGNTASAAACQGVVGREHTAHKGNDGKAVFAVVA